MVRSFAIKGFKRKQREENYDREDIEELTEEEKAGTEEAENALDEDKEGGTHELAGIPIQPFDQKTQTGAIFILEKASLEVAKVGKTYQLLNSDDHANFLRRNNKNPADYRPDIAHQAILAILDSPLNKAGRMRALYVKTEKGVLFEVKPHVRIPRTYKRFAGIMLQLLQKLNITAVGKREKLLRVIKNPVTQYLPLNSHKIGFSFSSQKLVDIRDYVASVSNDVNFVFVVGAMSHGKINQDYVEDFISRIFDEEGREYEVGKPANNGSQRTDMKGRGERVLVLIQTSTCADEISGYPLSAAGCIGRICGGLEHKWNVL